MALSPPRLVEIDVAVATTECPCRPDTERRSSQPSSFANIEMVIEANSSSSRRCDPMRERRHCLSPTPSTILRAEDAHLLVLW